MAAPAETSGTAPARKSRAEARRAERAPSGGWRTIAAKELADHIASWRFFVLLFVIGALSLLPVVFASGDIRGVASQASGNPRVFLAMFTVGSQSFGGFSMVQLVLLLVPLVGIAFGFDGVNSERSQGTLSRLLAQPVHRDDVINGKFAAGIAVITVMMVMLSVLVTALGILQLGITPTAEDIARLVLWLVATVLYASFWLAFALLVSVVIRSTATAALLGFGAWIAVTLIGAILLPIIAGFLFPIDSTSSLSAQFGANYAQSILLRISPAQLYNDVLTAILNPSVKALFISNTGQAANVQSQLPGLLSLDQSVLLIWPQLVALVALTVVLFALSYVLFLRQEVRA